MGKIQSKEENGEKKIICIFHYNHTFFKKIEKWDFCPESANLDFTKTRYVLSLKESISAKWPKEHEFQRHGEKIM